MQVSERVWADEHEWSRGEEGVVRVTWETQVMEVKGQVISAPGEKGNQTVGGDAKALVIQ